jgi:hypothetical protein
MRAICNSRSLINKLFLCCAIACGLHVGCLLLGLSVNKCHQLRWEYESYSISNAGNIGHYMVLSDHQSSVILDKQMPPNCCFGTCILLVQYSPFIGSWQPEWVNKIIGPWQQILWRNFFPSLFSCQIENSLVVPYLAIKEDLFVCFVLYCFVCFVCHVWNLPDRAWCPLPRS